MRIILRKILSETVRCRGCLKFNDVRSAYPTRKERVRIVFVTVVPVVLSRTGTAQFGTQFSVTISRAGDYLIRAWLRAQVPAISITWTSSNVPVSGWNPAELGIRWTRNWMHNLIQEASITFNDLVEARFDSYFLDFWAAFTIPAGKRNGLTSNRRSKMLDRNHPENSMILCCA